MKEQNNNYSLVSSLINYKGQRFHKNLILKSPALVTKHKQVPFKRETAKRTDNKLYLLLWQLKSWHAHCKFKAKTTSKLINRR